jgi:hypothetical protein
MFKRESQKSTSAIILGRRECYTDGFFKQNKCTEYRRLEVTARVVCAVDVSQNKTNNT